MPCEVGVERSHLTHSCRPPGLGKEGCVFRIFPQGIIK